MIYVVFDEQNTSLPFGSLLFGNAETLSSLLTQHNNTKMNRTKFILACIKSRFN